VRPKIAVLGMMTKMPVAGVVWQTLHYLLGLRRLGFDVYYVEAHGRTPSMLMTSEHDDGIALASAFIDRALRPFDLGDRWAYLPLHEPAQLRGMTPGQLGDLWSSAALIMNLHGGTAPFPELAGSGRLVYVETDPVQLQIELHEGYEFAIEFLEPHCAFFTFGENLGAPDCLLPVTDRFTFFPTRQPVVLDLWEPVAEAGRAYTTIGNWSQAWREVSFGGRSFSWSKHHEWMKVLDLPERTGRPFEIALASYGPEDRALLEGRGWGVVGAAGMSDAPEPYRDYIARSRGEFTVAKEQNVHFRSGWFSDRSATYLAAGRPVVTQETGFSNVLPTGSGLFGWSTPDEAAAAIETIEGDYATHRRGALEIARECFSADVVLRQMLAHVGSSCARRGGVRDEPRRPRSPTTSSSSRARGARPCCPTRRSQQWPARRRCSTCGSRRPTSGRAS
jgi:hypothetical protein